MKHLLALLITAMSFCSIGQTKDSLEINVQFIASDLGLHLSPTITKGFVENDFHFGTRFAFNYPVFSNFEYFSIQNYLQYKSFGVIPIWYKGFGKELGYQTPISIYFAHNFYKGKLFIQADYWNTDVSLVICFDMQIGMIHF